MSEFVVVNTHINDLEALKRTLADFGIDESQIEVYDEPVRLEGWQGDRSRSAHVVIRKRILGNSYSDIGFERNADGTYRIWMTDSWGNRVASAIKNGEFLQRYAHRKILRDVEQQYGMRVESCEEKDGRIEIAIESD